MRFYVMIFCVLALRVAAQPIVDLRDVENQFAALSKSTNAMDAFLTYLADDAVLFSNGDAVNGKELWKQRPADQALLFWWPVWTDVAASGDLGYNAGVYEFAPAKDAAPVAFGYFSTIWKKNARGEWKVAVDMGAGTPSRDEQAPAWQGAIIKTSAVKDKTSPEVRKQQLLAWEGKYVDALHRAGRSFLPDQLYKNARVHRDGMFPLVTAQQIANYKDDAKKYKFELLGGDVAASGDLAYVYGRAKSVGADQKEIAQNYLRVLRRDNGKEWSIVLDVIGN